MEFSLGIAFGLLAWLAVVARVWSAPRMSVDERRGWALAVALLPIPLFPIFLIVANRRSNPGTACAAESIHPQG